MTTNHIEKIDKAFLRPGRVDLVVEIGYVTEETFRDFILNFFDIDIGTNFKLKTNKLTIAQLQQKILEGIGLEEILNEYVKDIKNEKNQKLQKVV